MRPLARLHRLGLVNRDLIAVHAVHLDASDIALLAAEGATVAHNPTALTPSPSLVRAVDFRADSAGEQSTRARLAAYSVGCSCLPDSGR